MYEGRDWKGRLGDWHPLVLVTEVEGTRQTADHGSTGKLRRPGGRISIPEDFAFVPGVGDPPGQDK